MKTIRPSYLTSNIMDGNFQIFYAEKQKSRKILNSFVVPWLVLPLFCIVFVKVMITVDGAMALTTKEVSFSPTPSPSHMILLLWTRIQHTLFVLVEIVLFLGFSLPALL